MADNEGCSVAEAHWIHVQRAMEEKAIREAREARKSYKPSTYDTEDATTAGEDFGLDEVSDDKRFNELRTRDEADRLALSLGLRGELRQDFVDDFVNGCRTAHEDCEDAE